MTEKPIDTVDAGLPTHLDATVQAIAQLHARHAAEASPSQQRVERATRRLGTPKSVIALTAFVVAWTAANGLLLAAGRKPFDAPPFFILQGLVGLAALYMTVLILTTQRRDDQLASLREQLTLELAILGEQKSAKIIALLEELRRDDPSISDRADTHADELSMPTDPVAVVDALRQRSPEQGR